MRKISLAAAGMVAMLTVPATGSAATGSAASSLRAGQVTVASTSRAGMAIVVPAYWYQGTPSWKTLATVRNPRRWPGSKSLDTVSEAVFNPCAPDGKTCSPGGAVNPAARKDMRAARSNGVTFYGYIWTGSGRVPAATVKKEVREYASWYGLRDIFLDGASTDCTTERSYYLPLYTYVHSRHGKVILNPGTQPPSCYLRAADQISVFEGTGAQFATYTPAPWMSGYPAARFIAIVHTTSGASAMARVITQAGHHDHIGNIYVTSQHMPNPYTKLPAYWRQEITKVSKSYAQ